jgi:hypothetical protein
VVSGGPGSVNDEQCRIVDGRLRVADPPRLTATCLLEAYVPASGSRPAAEPRRALITISFPRFAVSVVPVPDVDWSALATKRVNVTVREDSGDAYFIWVGGDSSSGSYDQCTGHQSPYPSAPGTTQYRVGVTLADPGTVSYTCHLQAVAGPVDIAGGRASDSFTITVNP